MSKMTCEICGSEFYPVVIGSNHYIVRDSVKTGLGVAFSSTEEYKLYDAFDCPVCKCQNIIGERKRGFVSAVSENVIPDEVVFIEKEENVKGKKPECYMKYKNNEFCNCCEYSKECEAYYLESQKGDEKEYSEED